ncbi:IS4 family transposase [Sporosarcina oncorhynchi]|uniref:IS4 family transposase n=1 Tax=Sporosarcina oncorhynchi TaxID=3056444 RepID=A0ABZ0L1E6_9BACL|nr:IS4 family transposase [Sporosarcina sp. T2O-4]WOV86024.1 IS4 family transposase [Sporosarcina sp. T2O-4]WOV86630.1 IS4 family transposase [Sporosarcina sp. T2O-4]WOV88591.1 IS4 family transposase [Sporosarcina sp. T2O-4]WOV88867.1 IS4 family transposase [Sporosarcina sp. T2O-4]
MTTSQTTQLLEQLFESIQPTRVDEIAKETGFIKRKRLVTASDFLALLFQFHGNFAGCSIQELCSKLVIEQDILISRTALDKKFTPEAALFLRRLVQEILHHQFLEHVPTHSSADPFPFLSIRVLDATAIEVPDHLKKRAVKTEQESVKIQYEYDILSGKTTFLDIDFQRVNDTRKGAERLAYINDHDLCLQDLGYFSFEQFGQMQENGGFFITKLRNDAYLAFKNPFPAYHQNGKVVQSSLYQRIDLVKLCENLEPGEYLELEGVHFGRDSHFPARCIVFSHDETQRQHRLKKIHRRTTKSGKKPKKVVSDLAGITVYMTNLPESIPAKKLVELYRLRWHVELCFKTWKSYLGVDQFKVMKKERWLCHLYGTLLAIIISQLIAYQLRNVIWDEEQLEISEMIAVRTVAIEFLPKLYRIFIHKKRALKDFLCLAIRLLIKTARKPKSSKGTALQRLQFN